jgi:hypothetical protein
MATGYHHSGDRNDNSPPGCLRGEPLVQRVAASHASNQVVLDRLWTDPVDRRFQWFSACWTTQPFGPPHRAPVFRLEGSGCSPDLLVSTRSPRPSTAASTLGYRGWRPGPTRARWPAVSVETAEDRAFRRSWLRPPRGPATAVAARALARARPRPGDPTWVTRTTRPSPNLNTNPSASRSMPSRPSRTS